MQPISEHLDESGLLAIKTEKHKLSPEAVVETELNDEPTGKSLNF
jgi:hypothetical protein